MRSWVSAQERRIRVDIYLQTDAELLIMKLRAEAKNGRLDWLIEDLMNRLFEFTDVPRYLRKLIANLPNVSVKRLVGGGKLDEAVKRMLLRSEDERGDRLFGWCKVCLKLYQKY